MEQAEHKLMSVNEFRAALGHKVGRNSVYAAIRKQNGIKHIRLEGVWEIPIKQNWEWIDALNAWS